MSNNSERTAEMTIDLSPQQVTSVDSGVLRRGMKFGQQARARFGNRPFPEIEVELKRAWEQRGATVSWESVKAAVRLGYDAESPDEEP